MKTELDITRIMDDYTDNEFGIEGELAVDEEKAVTDLLSQVQPKRKKVKPLFKVLAAAAAAVVLAGTAIGVTTGLGHFFHTATGTYVEYHDVNGAPSALEVKFDTDSETSPIVLREGKLWFVCDGQEIDLTGLIDEETPYIYTYENEDSGEDSYVVVGGTAEEYGYANIFTINDDRWESVEATGTAATFDGCTLYMGMWDKEYHKWFLSALKQLDINVSRLHYSPSDLNEGYQQSLSHKMDMIQWEGDLSNPVKTENGRLIFTADGQSTDITDLIGEGTPYVYACPNDDDMLADYVIVGGAADKYGYAHVFRLGDDKWYFYTKDAYGIFPGWSSGTTVAASVFIDPVPSAYQSEALNEQQLSPFKDWFRAALEQLEVEIGTVHVTEHVD